MRYAKARLRMILAAAAVMGLAASPAAAQLLGGRGGLLPGIAGAVPGTIGNTAGGLGNAVNDTLRSTATVVRDVVGRPLNTLRSARYVEKDVNGAAVVRGEVLCLTPTDETLATARKLDFEVARQESLPDLGLSIAVLRTPDGMSVTDALKTLRSADPAGSFDYNHIYNPSGEGTAGAAAATGGSVPGVARIGMIDAGLDRRHPALRDAAIETKSFAGDASPPTEHGTAVASLLVGQDGDFHGALRGATLYAADVFGGAPAGGSADDIARALAWLASEHVPVANISLAGPPNMLLAAATEAFIKRGHVLVAAVGNDGPAAQQRYPAAYPGVAGVTSVDRNRAIQIDANRGADVAFAARGVAVRAAALKGRYAEVTGTSFAAPVVAARFAQLVPRADTALSARAWATLERQAVDLGTPGRDPVFGYGYLDSPQAASAVARQ